MLDGRELTTEHSSCSLIRGVSVGSDKNETLLNWSAHALPMGSRSRRAATNRTGGLTQTASDELVQLRNRGVLSGPKALFASRPSVPSKRAYRRHALGECKQQLRHSCLSKAHHCIDLRRHLSSQATIGSRAWQRPGQLGSLAP
jgi:hypothetical protein